MKVTFKEGDKTLIPGGHLLTVPGTGDIITDPAGLSYLVTSVVHQNVFNSPGEHEITVNVEQQ